MPLGDQQALQDWVDREDPRVSVLVHVGGFVNRLADEPWVAPSKPIDFLSKEGEYQTRSVVVPGTDVEVLYTETYATKIVDLIAIASLPSEDESAS